jgi:hypothetical protein
MKKTFLLLCMAILFSAGHIYAQGFHLGVKGGVDLTKIDGRSFESGFKWGFAAGAFAELNFTQHVGLQPEFLFVQTNTKTASDFADIYEQPGNSLKNVQLNYLSMPILLSLRPVPLLSILVGPQFGLKLSDNLGNTAVNAFKSGDFSVVGGAQLNLSGFKAGARYVIGLNNINDINNNYKWKNQQIQLYIGFRII